MHNRHRIWVLSGAVALVLSGGMAGEITLTVKRFVPGIRIPPGNQSAISGLAISPDETKLYAAYWTDHQSSCPVAIYPLPGLDPVDVDTVRYGHNHGDVVLSPDGRYMYTHEYYSSDLKRFDIQDGYSETSLGIGSWPVQLWIAPDGGTIVAGTNEWSGSPDCEASLALVDVRDGSFSLLATVPLGHNLSGGMANKCTFSADSRHIYVGTGRSNVEGPALLEVGLTAPYQIERSLVFDMGDHLEGVARAGDKLYVGAMEARRINIVDVTSFSEVDAIDLPEEVVNCALHPDNRHLFVLFDASLWVIDITTKALAGSLEGLEPGLTDIEFSPGPGSTAYVAHISNERGGITVVDIGMQPPDAAFAVSSPRGNCTLEASILLSSVHDVAGISLGLAHDSTRVCLSEIRPGATWSTPPDLWFADVDAAPCANGKVGGTLAIVVASAPPLRTLPPGSAQEIARFVYEAHSPGSSPLEFVDCLGSPPVALEVSALLGPASVQPEAIVAHTRDGILTSEGICFVRGDVDQNGHFSINDAISILYFLFSGLDLVCLSSADIDDDEAIDVSDPIYLLSYLFRKGPAPAAPFPDCGADPTPDTLECETFRRCQACP